MNTQEIALLTQVEPERVAQVRVDFQALQRDGALLQIHCFGLSAIERKATNAERGIADDDPRANRLSAGRIKTIPGRFAKQLVSVRESARSSLDRASFDVTGFRPWRYVPVRAFENWLETQQSYEQRFDALKLECAEAMDEFVVNEVGRCQELAGKAWLALWANAEKRGRYYEVTVDGVTYLRNDSQRQEFVERMTEHALSKIPSRNDIMDSMRLYWSVGNVSLWSSVEQERANHEAALAETREARARQAVAHREAHEAELAIRNATAEHETMRQVLAERIREQLTHIPDPGVEIVEQLRRRTGDAARSVSESLSAKGRLYRGTRAALDGMVDRFDLLNHGDDELEQAIAELRQKLSVGNDGYDYEGMARALANIEHVCKKQVDENIGKTRTVLEVAALVPAIN